MNISKNKIESIIKWFKYLQFVIMCVYYIYIYNFLIIDLNAPKMVTSHSSVDTAALLSHVMMALFDFEIDLTTLLY